MPLFPIFDGKRYGYADERGSVVIPPRFTKIPIAGESRFSEGLALACEGPKYGYIAPNGDWALPAAWDNAGRFSDGLAAVATKKKWTYIDPKGTPLKGGWFKATSFSAGRAFVEREPGSGFELIDKTGARVGATTFAGSNNDKDLTLKAQPHSDGLAAAMDRETGKWGFADLEGSWALPPRWKAVRGFQDGLACVQTDENIVSFIDREGREKLRYPMPYLSLGVSSEGLVAMPDPKDSLSKAYYRHDGTLAIRARREHQGTFSTGRALYRLTSGFCGFIDPTGTVVIEPTFLSAEPFVDGLAKVVPDPKKPGRFGYIDVAGRLVIAP